MFDKFKPPPKKHPCMGVFLIKRIEKMNEEKFYKSKKWRRKRERVLKRDNYVCQKCKRYGKNVEATTVHHIKHLKNYPELALDENNLISLCERCHNKEHPEKAKKGRKYQAPPD